MKGHPPLRVRFARSLAAKAAWALSRFTAAGKLVLLGYGVTIFFVVDTRTTLNYQIFGLLIALLLFAVSLGLMRKGSFSLRRMLPRHATVGVPLRYVVQIRNMGLVETRSLDFNEDIAWSETAPPRPAASVLPASIDSIPAGEEHNVSMQLLPLTRGVLEFRTGILGLVDPLGLYKRLLPLPAPEKLVVLPRTYPVPSLDLRAGRRYQPGGRRTSLSSGDSQEFAGLRDYRPGDPVRHIHWPSFARFGEPKVKEFQDEYQTRLALVLDTFPWRHLRTWRAPLEGQPAHQDSIQESVFEAAVSVAASLAAAKRPQDTTLDLLFVADKARQVSAERGRADEQGLLEALAAVTPCMDKPFDVLERVVLRHAALVGGVVLVLLAWDDRRRSLVDSLRAAGLTIRTVLVADPPASAMEGLPPPDAIIRPDHIEQDLAAL